jgi:hypothetical protein
MVGCGGGCDEEREVAAFPELQGPYLGQGRPGSVPEVFAPGIVSTGLAERDVAVTPDGMEMYFGVTLGRSGTTTIVGTRVVDGLWTRAEVVPWANDPGQMNLEPHVSPDGSRLLFMSNRPRQGGEGAEVEADEDIWAMDRVGEGWGEPYNLGPPVNTEGGEYFPSTTRDGTLYFTRRMPGERVEAIYRARLVDGQYAEPERLPEEVNGSPTQFNACVAPDESYVIVCGLGREDSVGSVDYYVSFRSEDGSWSGPINLGELVNTESGEEYSPSITADGRILFFMATRPELGEAELTMDRLQEMSRRPRGWTSDIYWVDASFIERLRPQVPVRATPDG